MVLKLFIITEHWSAWFLNNNNLTSQLYDLNLGKPGIWIATFALIQMMPTVLWQSPRGRTSSRDPDSPKFGAQELNGPNKQT